MKKIKLTQDKFALVDDEDFELVSKYKWKYNIPNRSTHGYAITYDKGMEFVLMHRLIIEAPKRVFTDHINGDTLDNRKENLRLCTASQNRYNSGKTRKNKSGYKGVCFSKKFKNRPFRAKIGFNKKRIIIGFYSTAEEAARAYDKMAKKLHKEFAYLNFPDG